MMWEEVREGGQGRIIEGLVSTKTFALGGNGEPLGILGESHGQVCL